MDQVINHRFDFSVSGEGDTLVLLHSLLSDRRSFDAIAPRLAERFRVVVPALPGFGESAPVEGGLEGVADRIAELVEAQSAGRGAILLGNGYGAFVALTLASRRPDLVQRLILAGCGARFSDPGRQAFLNMAEAAESGGLEAVADTAMARLFGAEFQAAHPELIQDRRAAFLATDPAVFKAACRALAALDLTDQAAAVAVPTLIVAGDEDRATPATMAEALAALMPRAEFRLLIGCAHVPPLQAPDQFLETIEDGLVATADPVSPR